MSRPSGRRLPRVHAVTDEAVLTLPDLAGRARALALAGEVALHARSRLATARRLLAITAAFRETGAAVFVNDRLDLALVAGAIGVHLPSGGIPVAVARALLGPGRTIGRSTHDPEEARHAATEGADYVFLGPIWPTPSHPERPPIGPEAIAAAQPARVIAIGGITPQRARICREHGAYGVAAISGLWGAADPGSAAEAMLLSFE